MKCDMASKSPCLIGVKVPRKQRIHSSQISHAWHEVLTRKCWSCYSLRKVVFLWWNTNSTSAHPCTTTTSKQVSSSRVAVGEAALGSLCNWFNQDSWVCFPCLPFDTSVQTLEVKEVLQSHSLLTTEQSSRAVPSIGCDLKISTKCWSNGKRLLGMLCYFSHYYDDIPSKSNFKKRGVSETRVYPAWRAQF